MVAGGGNADAASTALGQTATLTCQTDGQVGPLMSRLTNGLLIGYMCGAKNLV